MTYSHDQITVAARAWLDATRREWINRNPDEARRLDCPVPTWEQLTIRDRQSFVVCIGAALNATDPANVARVLERDAERGE